MAEWKVPGYTELRALGSGGFGEVMLARHHATGVLVAIKYLRPEFLADQEFARMFRSEAEVLASLDDPFIVRLYEYVESPAGAAIVMELVDGVSLREILARQGRTSAEAALVVLRGSLLGLAAAHRRGVVHRDYKPENVLIDGAGVSKLTDFGLAARTGELPIPAGTLRYVAPEQIAGAPASPASDVYSATATFYECLTGVPPFRGESEEELLRQLTSEPVPLDPLPERLRPLVAAGMAKEPWLRPADAMAFVARLQTVAAGAYGQDWADRGRSHLGEAALLLAALWPAGGAPAVQGNAVQQIRLSHGQTGQGQGQTGQGQTGQGQTGQGQTGQGQGQTGQGQGQTGQGQGQTGQGQTGQGQGQTGHPTGSGRPFRYLNPIRIGIIIGVIAIIVAGCMTLTGPHSFVPVGNPTSVQSVPLQPSVSSTPESPPTPQTPSPGPDPYSGPPVVPSDNPSSQYPTCCVG
jgi:serine/threonine protein kinase